VGMRSDLWEIIHEVDSTDCTIEEQKYFYVCFNTQTLENPPQNPDHDEILDTRWVNLLELQSMLDTKDISWTDDALVALQVLRAYE